MGEGGREPAPPNRNASNDKFVTKTAILLSFSWFVFILTRDREDLIVFFALYFFFRKKFSSSDRETCSCCFLFWSSLYAVSCGLVPPFKS